MPARGAVLRLVLLSLLLPSSRALRPRFSWDTLGNMSFFHACNESGLFSEEALDTITKFPFVTIEKGQGFNDGSAPCTASGGSCAEDKIIAQISAIKSRDPTISTVFYMNSVLDWYFYRMHYQFLQHPDWWLRCSQGPDEAPRGGNHSGQPITTGGARPTRDQAKGCTGAGAPFYTSGDRHFNPPEEGMLVFDDSKPAVRDFWLGVCFRAVATGVVDGCFSDSSEVGSHKTGAALNRSTNASYEAGKVTTMTQATARFGGTAGTPYPPGANGTLIGKFPNQLGINALQIEMFTNSEPELLVLMDAVSRGYLVQAHVTVNNLPVTNKGCPEMEDTAATFLIGAGENSYFGSGSWIIADNQPRSGLEDVQTRWCPELFERPLGKPKADAVKGADGVWRREFASGTKVTFDSSTGKGKIMWAQ